MGEVAWGEREKGAEKKKYIQRNDGWNFLKFEKKIYILNKIDRLLLG